MKIAVDKTTYFLLSMTNIQTGETQGFICDTLAEIQHQMQLFPVKKNWKYSIQIKHDSRRVCAWRNYTEETVPAELEGMLTAV